MKTLHICFRKGGKATPFIFLYVYVYVSMYVHVYVYVYYRQE